LEAEPATDRIDSVLSEHALDCVSTDFVAEVHQRAANARVAPTRILESHPDDEALDFAVDSRTPRQPLGAAVVLLRNQLAIPVVAALARDAELGVPQRDGNSSRLEQRQSGLESGTTSCASRRCPSLREVVAFYDRGGVPHENLDPRIRPLGLEASEIDDLVAFLESLTGADVDALVVDAFAAPIGDAGAAKASDTRASGSALE
jgi:hypothetical protein